MNGRPAIAGYITRAEEKGIGDQLAMVRATRESRAVLLYGEGGVGKTSLVRHMADPAADDGAVWVPPIDVDDPEIWLLSNLERKVADRLDPDDRHFAEFRRRLSRLPSPIHADISHETIISHLNRLREVFADCYESYVADGKTVVIVFDTVETIRGTNLARTLTQWIKALPAGTLFILSGRPPAADPAGQRDQLEAELHSRYRGVPVTTIQVSGFAHPQARDYIRKSGIAGTLIGNEEEALVLLSRGHPLWLAFLIDYLRAEGVPAEATQYSLTELERYLPFGQSMTEEGERLHEDFLRRLLAPYQVADFWHEAIKRLAVVRQPVAKTVWQRLMRDCALPAGTASLDAAWKEMLDRPWIRPRANRRYLTLHDAVAEEFARRFFPLQDQDQRWRHGIWREALGIYSELAAGARPRVEQMRAALDERLESVGAARAAGDATAPAAEPELMSRSVELDMAQRRFDQLRAASLYYTFLTDFGAGCRRLLEYYDEARKRHDSFFQDLLVLYLDRFLPGRSSSAAFNDVIALKLGDFRRWLEGAGQGFHVALGIMVGRYLVDSAQAQEALTFLGGLPDGAATGRERHDLSILRGNACLRTGGQAREAIGYFQHAINHAEESTEPDRHKLIAEAYKELGFYYRNTGRWREADESYRHAWTTIVGALSADSPAQDHAELASIQTNWAYIKGLSGSYLEGIDLAETAADSRHTMGLTADEGLSRSVCGEVYRYARRFDMAWRAYAQAERLLLAERPYWDRLGFVYQEQAICLYQAARDRIPIDGGMDLMAEAGRLIRKALELCLAYAIRAYPSALNRAGRIIGAADPDAGLKYLEEGISEAQRLSDGWFWFANLVEYAELSYRRWRDSGAPRYRANIDKRSAELDRVAGDYSFPDLKGRWSLLKGHLAVRDYHDSNEAARLDEALVYYEKGFADLATKHVASSGATSLKAEFDAFEVVFTGLPADARAAWQARLRSAWTAAGELSTLLLAHLEKLVIGLPGEV